MSAVGEHLKGIFAALITVAAGGSVALILISIMGNVLKQFPIESTNPFYNFTKIISGVTGTLTTYAPIAVTVVVVMTLVMPLILWLWKQWT
ncbi:MAG: hypothetical protein QXR12_06740 [Thermofilum sp.]